MQSRVQTVHSGTPPRIANALDEKKNEELCSGPGKSAVWPVECNEIGAFQRPDANPPGDPL